MADLHSDQRLEEETRSPAPGLVRFRVGDGVRNAGRDHGYCVRLLVPDSLRANIPAVC